MGSDLEAGCGPKGKIDALRPVRAGIVGCGLGLLACGWAVAAPPAAVLWSCEYDGRTSVVCALVSAPEGPTEGTRIAGERLEAAFGRRRIPGVMRDIRNRPAQLAGRSVVIPMYGIPCTMEDVRELASNVMCGSNPQCAVAFGARLSQR